MPDHNHPAEERPIYIISNIYAGPDDGTPVTIVDHRYRDIYKPLEPLDIDDPANDGTILAVLRALHDRRPDLYHSARLAPDYDFGGSYECSWCDAIVARRSPPGDGQQ